MSASSSSSKWVLYSPAAPAGTTVEATGGVPIDKADTAPVEVGEHEGGFFLTEAQFEGWQFGLLQDTLQRSGLVAFVRSPSGVEATLVSDPHAPEIERLSVPPKPGYLGAFRIPMPLPLDSMQNILSGFKLALPLVKQKFAGK